jgi:hypothetical protein
MSNPALNHLLARTRIVLCKNKKTLYNFYIIYFRVLGRDESSSSVLPLPSFQQTRLE